LGKSRATKKKRIADALLEKHPNAFSSDFDENKRIMNELLSIESKQLRNDVAGYLTRAMHDREKQAV
jgi:small subunit ribosomal protein S17e